MRLDARVIGLAAAEWKVYDAEACRMIKDVVWVDDETHQYGQYITTVTVDVVTRQAKLIAIYPGRKLIIINPVEDNENAGADAIATIVLVSA